MAALRSMRTAFLFCVAAILVCGSAWADDRGKSSPPDTTPYARAPVPDDFDPGHTGQNLPASAGVFIRDAVVSNTDHSLKRTDIFTDWEVSIAVDPLNRNEIVMTAFSGSWSSSPSSTAPLWLSTNGGGIWTKEFSINAPPGAGGIDGCPCDQTVDFADEGVLAGAFLTATPDNIYAALTENPKSATPGFDFYQSPPGTAQAINHLDGVNDEDQPWLLVGSDRVYVAYDDFNTEPVTLHVAVAAAADPLTFEIDNVDGSTAQPDGGLNPGHRLAIGTVPGTVYSAFQSGVGAGADGSQNIDYMLNRSTDGGVTWGLNGNAGGIVVANADSTQPTPKFCTVNALLGGVDHIAVDPTTGDVIYVYGDRDSTGNNRLAMKVLTDNGNGGLTVPTNPILITGQAQVQAALPSVAVNKSGVIGIFYYTCDSTTGSFPMLTAHFAISTNHGKTFTTKKLETFLSAAADNTSDNRQRVLGDYMQVKAVGNTFYGGFTGNGVPFGRSLSNMDPIFYKITVP
jgi:hypothetical protein